MTSELTGLDPRMPWNRLFFAVRIIMAGLAKRFTVGNLVSLCCVVFPCDDVVGMEGSANHPAFLACIGVASKYGCSPSPVLMSSMRPVFGVALAMFPVAIVLFAYGWARLAHSINAGLMCFSSACPFKCVESGVVGVPPFPGAGYGAKCVLGGHLDDGLPTMATSAGVSAFSAPYSSGMNGYVFVVAHSAREGVRASVPGFKQSGIWHAGRVVAGLAAILNARLRRTERRSASDARLWLNGTVATHVIP